MLQEAPAWEWCQCPLVTSQRADFQKCPLLRLLKSEVWTCAITTCGRVLQSRLMVLGNMNKANFASRWTFESSTQVESVSRIHTFTTSFLFRLFLNTYTKRKEIPAHLVDSSVFFFSFFWSGLNIWYNCMSPEGRFSPVNVYRLFN